MRVIDYTRGYQLNPSVAATTAALEKEVFARFRELYPGDAYAQRYEIGFGLPFYHIMDVLQGEIEGKVIVDIGCGSHTFNGRAFVRPGDSAKYLPWLCRGLHILGVHVIGIDIGDMTGEPFEHYQGDVQDFNTWRPLQGRQVDLIQERRLYDSPEMMKLHEGELETLQCRRIIFAQIVSRDEGIFLHAN